MWFGYIIGTHDCPGVRLIAAQQEAPAKTYIEDPSLALLAARWGGGSSERGKGWVANERRNGARETSTAPDMVYRVWYGVHTAFRESSGMVQPQA